MSEQPTLSRGGVFRRAVEQVGLAGRSVVGSAQGTVEFVGGAGFLLGDTVRWILRGLFVPRTKFGVGALATQMFRVGVLSVPIVVLVQVFIGIILVLQMSPTLASYGQSERVADIVGIAMFRELGPLIAGIVLSGFAGASIAAEIGAMVESEEIKALRAHALNPIPFLVVPRIVATTVMLVGLTIISDVVGVFGGYMTGVFLLDVPSGVYIEYTLSALHVRDFVTGLFKAGVFGLLISLIACYEGLTVSGGAVGVGRATTSTVVKSIVALIVTDCAFTTVFYMFGL